MLIKIKSSNSILANFVSQLHLGSLRRLRYITVAYTELGLLILQILYKEGVLRTFNLQGPNVLIYFKYHLSSIFFRFKLISKPGKRVYWSLHNLSLFYSSRSFSGFYIISTPHGLLTSHECLLYKHLSGEVLLKIFV